MITDSVKISESEVEVFDYKAKDGLIVLMDCGGSNAEKVDEQLRQADPEFRGIRLIATGRKPWQDCKAKQRAEELKVPLVELDFQKLEEEQEVFPGDYLKAMQILEIERQLRLEKGKDPMPLARGAEEAYLVVKKAELVRNIRSELYPEEIVEVRKQICTQFIDEIKRVKQQQGIGDIPCFAAGFMQLLSKDAVEYLNPENVHPGDVTKYSLNDKLRGSRIIVGDAWIPPARAISSGHDMLYSSMHKLIDEMDAGPVYMRGYGLPIDYNYLLSRVDIRKKKVLEAVGTAAQEALKHIGDHVIAGAVFKDIYDRNWGCHIPSGSLTYRFNGEWFLAPNSIMIQDHIANNPKTVFQRDQGFIDDKAQEFYKEVDKIAI